MVGQPWRSRKKGMVGQPWRSGKKGMVGQPWRSGKKVRDERAAMVKGRLLIRATDKCCWVPLVAG